ncbi:Hypothetical_protein [Hexamita inflata]|uniref:Hypothetical_protein n=1 Tax=Hexamita inflata TaxID=28002 RepID=A0AA86QP12_9EUKA|nr:Hypothetical protein HINF_LOCUS45247 [Hexamita inflata]
MHAYLENQTCDFSSVQDIWSSIRFSNCLLRGAPGCKFKNTTIEFWADEYCRAIDFSPLQGTQAILHIHLKNVQVDLAQVQLCSPKELSMRCCIIQLSQLVGNWQTLTLNQSCDFIQPSEPILPGSIHAEKLIISDVSQQICSYFSANVFELGRTTNEINILPNAHELLLIRSTIKLTHFNYQIKELQLYNAKLRKFSVLYTPELQKIDLNCINDRDATKQAIINFLRQKKKHKNVVKQKLNRIIYEEKRNSAVKKRLQILQTNLIIQGEHVQFLWGGIE